MTDIVRFYKKDGKWYADVPNHTIEECEMVYGTDTFFNLHTTNDDTKLIINKESIKDWTDDQKATIEKYAVPLNDFLPEYHFYTWFVEFCIKEGIFYGFNHMESTLVYGYANTRESLKKYLKQYADDTTKNYVVLINIMDRDTEKYYKNGPYINYEGIDTETDDYWRYIKSHPEEENFIDEDCKKDNFWITFYLFEISFKNDDEE